MLAVVGAAAIVIGAVAYFAFARHLRGPALAPTNAAVSLKTEFPPPQGWSEAVVADAFDYADSLGSSAVIAVADGHVIAEWGETDQKISAHSVRKSLVSALYGIAVERGLIDIDATLGELGIDDRDPPLSAIEKSARIEDLLTARSGIYHASLRDDNGPYPEPGTHRPNEVFVYNNWSFNAAGGIFEKLTGMSLGDAFKTWIADPIGMQDFVPADVRYENGPESVFPAFRFWMSARDLMRFGLLYLNGGRWEDRQIVPADWVAASLTPRSKMENGVGYGYMWWIMPDGSYLATGTGGQKIRIYPEKKLVIVNRVDTGDGFTRMVWWNLGPRVKNGNLTAMRKLLEARLAEAGIAGFAKSARKK